MDVQNDNEQETTVDSPEKSSETENCDMQEQNVNDSNDVSKLSELSAAQDDVETVLDKTGVSHSIEDDSSSETPQSPSSLSLNVDPTTTNEKLIVGSETSPLSNESEESSKEISLDSGDVDKEKISDSNIVSTEELINSNDSHKEPPGEYVPAEMDRDVSSSGDQVIEANQLYGNDSSESLSSGSKDLKDKDEDVNEDKEDIVNDDKEEIVNIDKDENVNLDKDENVNEDKDNTNEDKEVNMNVDKEENVTEEKDDVTEEKVNDVDKSIEENVKDDQVDHLKKELYNKEECLVESSDAVTDEPSTEKDESHLRSKEEDRMECEDSEGGMESKELDESKMDEDTESKSECVLLSTDHNVIDSSKSDDGSDRKDGDDGPSGSMFSFSTSIFPGPPADKDKVVVANCFELDDITDSTSANLKLSEASATPVDNSSSLSPSFPTSMRDTTPDKSSSKPGPSDDREDISDDEFDDEPSSNADAKQDSADKPCIIHPVTSLDKSDNGSMNSSDVGDIIDLKLEDAALKSIGSSCDTEDNRQSKVSNEDLEAVSDDELPNAPQVSDLVLKPPQTNLLDDREEVSSSEDEEMNAQPNSVLPVSSGDEFSSSIPNVAPPVSESEEKQGMEKTEAGSLSRLDSLEAEPISDEEDNAMNNEESKQNSFDDGEAGEIKSPALGSPISEQGDLMLGEVEPVSADENPDTDGELPSGDEAEKPDDKQFESIDSDDDIVGDTQKSNQQSSVGNRLKKSSSAVTSEGMKHENEEKSEYMETISDEENLDGDDSEKKQANTSNAMPSSAASKENAMDKGRVPTSFNEHQLELDYEETYGDDGETKPESEEQVKTVAKVKDTDKEEGEDQDEGLASDKDEGELSDDDCEEGEIKEPGLKKMFVKPVCRFFQRGHCTWGINCRFLHPGVNDKGNYQMIEVPGFKPAGIRARLGVQGQWPEQQPQQPPPQEEVEELPPPPIPDIPHVETAWERGLRIAKEQRKKASERKEKEPDFEEKRLNLSVDEERELNKENERTPKIAAKDPYYDQQAYEVDEYYKIPRDPWHTGHYENFEVRYHQEKSYSPPYSPPFREKPPAPPMRYTRPMSPPIDKFGRNREERPEPERHEPLRVSDYPPPPKHPDEWIDPWRRSKSPKQRKPRSRSRGRKNRRSVSDSSDSSRSSRSSSGSSRSSRSGSGSSGSSSRSRSPEPAPPGVDRPDRYGGSDQPRSMVSVRGPQNQRDSHHNNNHSNNNNNRYEDHNNFRYNNNRGGGGGRGGGGRMYNNNGPDNRNMYKPRQDNMFHGGGGGRGGGGGYYGNHGNNHNNNFRGGFGGRGGGGGMGPPGGYNNRDPRAGGRDNRHGRNNSPVRGGRGPTPDRPLPYTRPRPKSRSSSRSSSSRSRSRSRRSKSSDSSRSHSSSNSSRSSSSSSSSGGSADSDHLYRDLGSPSKNPRHPGGGHKKRIGGERDGRKDRVAKGGHSSPGQPGSRHPPPSGNPDRIPHGRSPPHGRGGDMKYSQIPLPPPGGRGDSKYASRNAPQAPVKAKDPLKMVGQKSNIKLTLLPKQQQQAGLGDRPNPLASPPHKRRLSDRDTSPASSAPPPKRINVPMPMPASSLRIAAEKAAKISMRQEKAKSPPAGSLPPLPSANPRSKNPPPPTSPQKQPSSKPRTSSDGGGGGTKAPSGGSASSNPSGAKSKKSMSSRREELLKQLKAVEDAIARKKVKMS